MMVRTILAVALALLACQATANPIDDQCHQLTYKAAPIAVADQYVCHKQYAVAFSYVTKNPVYTAEFLDKSHTGSLPRTNDFKVDPAIPKDKQASPADYDKAVCGPGTDRCDRGHMTPDQDFSACAQCVHESFYMSNMVPQNFKNNEVVWKGMETKIRAYAATRPSGVFVITGPAYSGRVRTIGRNMVQIPDALFKIIIDADTGKTMTFFMPNAPQDDLKKWVSNLAAVEAATSLKFDSSLNKQTVSSLF